MAGNLSKSVSYPRGFEDGKKAEYDAFWDAFQQNGERSNYYMAFPYWEDACYNPKYSIGTASKGAITNMMFDSAKITDTKVDIFVRGSAVGSMFRACTELVTVKRLVLAETITNYGNFATNCTSLRNLNVEGVINGNIDLHWSPLEKESVESVVAALSDTATGLTITLNNTQMYAIQNQQTDAGNYNWFEKLEATKPNWTFALLDVE